MSIRDEIRDDIYGSDQDEEKIALAEAGVQFSDLLESPRPYEAPRTLVICLLAEIAIIGAIFFGSRWLLTIANSQFIVYFAIGMIIVPFLLGFTIAFTSYRLMKERFSPPDQPLDGPMSLIYRSESDGQMAIWYVSTAGGLINFVALNVLLFIMRGWVTLI